MRVLQGNGGIDPEPNETLFLLSDDQLLPLMDVRPLKKLMDRSRTEGEKFSTLRWWSVAANRCESFKQIDGQVENRSRNSFYFAMMICCCKQMWVLQINWWTSRERKEKVFELCDDDQLLLMDVRPSRTFTDRWRTEGETVSTLQWWTVATDRCASFKEFDGQVKNRSSDWFYFGLMICFGNQMPLRIHRSATMKRVVYMGDTD